ncbi:2235_t:CDS:2, partial [Acaulospora colombiana]
EGEIAAYYGRYLHSLRVPRGDRSLIQSAINLKELYLLHDQDLTFNFIRTLPLSMEHIACTASSGHYQAILNVLETKGGGKYLKNLKTISLYRHSMDLSPYSWDLLISQAMSVNVNIIRQEQRSFLVGGVAIEDELTVSIPPPRSRDPSPFRESNGSITPYSRSIDPSRSSLGLRQPIRLDQPMNVPRAWDYENDKPLERIVLDDPPSPERSRLEKWGRVRKSLGAISRRFGSNGS